MSQVKCYVHGKDNKLRAKIAGRWLGPKIVNGNVLIPGGPYTLNPKKFFRVDVPKWWAIGPVSTLPSANREISGQLWREGEAEPVTITGDGDTKDGVSTRALKFALAKTDLDSLEPPLLPPMMIIGLLALGAVIFGFVLGKF